MTVSCRLEMCRVTVAPHLGVRSLCVCLRGLTLSISLPLCLCETTDNILSKHSFIRLRVSHCYQARWHRQNLEHFWVYILPYWSRTPVLHCQTNRPYCQLRIGAAHHDLSRSRGDYLIAFGSYNMHQSGRQFWVASNCCRVGQEGGALFVCLRTA